MPATSLGGSTTWLPAPTPPPCTPAVASTPAAEAVATPGIFFTFVPELGLSKAAWCIVAALSIVGEAFIVVVTPLIERCRVLLVVPIGLLLEILLLALLALEATLLRPLLAVGERLVLLLIVLPTVIRLWAFKRHALIVRLLTSELTAVAILHVALLLPALSVLRPALFEWRRPALERGPGSRPRERRSLKWRPSVLERRTMERWSRRSTLEGRRSLEGRPGWPHAIRSG